MLQQLEIQDDLVRISDGLLFFLADRRLIVSHRCQDVACQDFKLEETIVRCTAGCCCCKAPGVRLLRARSGANLAPGRDPHQTWLANLLERHEFWEAMIIDQLYENIWSQWMGRERETACSYSDRI